MCELIGNRRSHAYNVVNLGGVMLLSGDPQSAKKMFEQGLAEAIELNDENLRAGEFGELGGLAVMIGDYAAATQLLEEERQAHAQMELVAHVMENTALLAKCALAEGRQEVARAAGGQVWNYLQVHGATAMYEAVPTYLTLIEVFETLAESSRASEDVSTVKSMVEVAYELVAARAEKISEPIWRQSFLQNVPSNRGWWSAGSGLRMDVRLNKASEDHTFANKYQTRVCLGSATQHA